MTFFRDSLIIKGIRPIVLMDIYQLIAPEDKTYFRKNREQELGVTLKQFSEKREQSLADLPGELQSIR